MIETTARADAATTDRESAARAVVEAAIVAFRRHAFHQVTAERIAADSGLTVETITEAFPTFDGLLEAAVDLWTARRLRPIVPIAEQSGVVAFLRAVITSNVADPGLMRLLAALVNIAATPEHPLSAVLQQKWLHFYALVQRTLARDVAIGLEPESMEVARGTEQLIALYEGLQIQSMVRPGMNMLDAYDRAVSRLRESYVRPQSLVWEL